MFFFNGPDTAAEEHVVNRHRARRKSRLQLIWSSGGAAEYWSSWNGRHQLHSSRYYLELSCSYLQGQLQKGLISEGQNETKQYREVDGWKPSAFGVSKLNVSTWLFFSGPHHYFQWSKCRKHLTTGIYTKKTHLLVYYILQVGQNNWLWLVLFEAEKQ